MASNPETSVSYRDTVVNLSAIIFEVVFGIFLNSTECLRVDILGLFNTTGHTFFLKSG